MCCVAPAGIGGPSDSGLHGCQRKSVFKVKASFCLLKQKKINGGVYRELPTFNHSSYQWRSSLVVIDSILSIIKNFSIGVENFGETHLSSWCSQQGEHLFYSAIFIFYSIMVNKILYMENPLLFLRYGKTPSQDQVKASGGCCPICQVATDLPCALLFLTFRPRSFLALFSAVRSLKWVLFLGNF